MISESQQEQATLYALGLLEADEAAAFETELTGNADLHDLVWELRDTAASLAEITTEAPVEPPRGLKERVLTRIATEGASHPGVTINRTAGHLPAPDNIVRGRFGWVPWAVAACLLGCSVILALDRTALLKEVSEARRVAFQPLPTPGDVLSQVAFCELEPTPDAPVKPRAAVLWDSARHEGVLRITQLAAPTAGKDYQLWAVEAARKETVNAGVVHVDADGKAEVRFKPDTIPGDNKVLALAISLEQAGGSPTNQGPVLFLGKF